MLLVEDEAAEGGDVDGQSALTMCTVVDVATE